MIMKKYLSLSFDDGPNLGDDTTMSDMLDILEKHGVAASFFMIGEKINEQNIPVIERALKMGCDIENHSWTHPDMAKLSHEQILEEYAKTDEAISKITGKLPEFFRPPYISVNQTLFDSIKTPFICGKDCRDWEDDFGVEDRLKMLLDGVVDGTILLLHVTDGNSKTLQVVDRAVPILKSQGYEFVTVPQLFEIRGIEKKNNGKLWTVVQ